MTPARVSAHRHNGEIRVESNLRTLDPCDIPDVFSAMAAHHGYDPEAMRKALVPHGEPPDPRYPGLITLIQQARRDWAHHGDRLVEAIDTLLKEGKLLPLTATSEAALQELFRDHRTSILARFAGQVSDLPRFNRLVEGGLLAASLTAPPLIDLAFKLGHGMNMLAVHRIPKLPRAGTIANPPPLAEVIRQALSAPPLAPWEQQALAYAQTRAGTYIRRPVDQSAGMATRVLENAELAAIRTVVSDSIATRSGYRATARALREATAAESMAHFDPADVAMVRNADIRNIPEHIREAMAHRTLQSDFDRIARTELQFAHAFGSYTRLKAQCADAGHKDPLVYKFASPDSCTDCRRIWGPMKTPNTYRLSYVERREAEGGNFHLPHAEWGPTIGPIHPNCTCSTLSFYDKALVNDINEGADEILATYRR